MCEKEDRLRRQLQRFVMWFFGILVRVVLWTFWQAALLAISSRVA
jgi:hypothetical protein